MTPAEERALADVRAYAGANRIVFTIHAQLRMGQRGARRDDVRSALVRATDCRATDQERWRVTGPDLDDDELTAIVVLESGVIVVTIF